MKIISVFGSAAPLPDSDDYQTAWRVGVLLAEAGFTVQTGGYAGIMEAASRGAAEAGGHVIGITSSQIEEFRPIPPNQWVHEEVKYPTLRQRLTHLVENCDGAVIMPGGVGTLSELALIWSLSQVGEISPRPIVAVGQLWAQTLKAFVSPRYINEEDVGLVQLADTPETACQLVQAFFAR